MLITIRLLVITSITRQWLFSRLISITALYLWNLIPQTFICNRREFSPDSVFSESLPPNEHAWLHGSGYRLKYLLQTRQRQACHWLFQIWSFAILSQPEFNLSTYRNAVLKVPRLMDFSQDRTYGGSAATYPRNQLPLHATEPGKKLDIQLVIKH